MSDRGAVLQFEIDIERWKACKSTTFSGVTVGESPLDRLYNMAKTAAVDTLYRGGTFVLVVTDKKVTMIQRPDAEEL